MPKSSTTISALVFAACILTLIILLICLGCGYYKWKDKTRAEVCLDTNETFVVQNNKDEPAWVGKEVARRLGHLAQKADKLVLYMYNNHLPDVNVATRLAERWKRIRENPEGLRETAFGETTAAYTVNKGEQLRICVRNNNSDNMFENENDMMFVFLHEAAHLMSKSYGHNLEFKKNFAYITKIAVELGLYKYVDYTKEPTSYCNVDITYPSY